MLWQAPQKGCTLLDRLCTSPTCKSRLVTGGKPPAPVPRSPPVDFKYKFGRPPAMAGRQPSQSFRFATYILFLVQGGKCAPPQLVPGTFSAGMAISSRAKVRPITRFSGQRRSKPAEGMAVRGPKGVSTSAPLRLMISNGRHTDAPPGKARFVQKGRIGPSLGGHP